MSQLVARLAGLALGPRLGVRALSAGPCTGRANTVIVPGSRAPSMVVPGVRALHTSLTRDFMASGETGPVNCGMLACSVLIV